MSYFSSDFPFLQMKYHKKKKKPTKNPQISLENSCLQGILYSINNSLTFWTVRFVATKKRHLVLIIKIKR